MQMTHKGLAATAALTLIGTLVMASPAYAADPTTISGAPNPTTATAGTTLTIADTVTLTGATVTPTGFVDFAFFDNSTCTGPAILTGTELPVTKTTGTSATSTFSTSWPAVEGTYFWVASYSGDTNNNKASTPCSDASQRVVVSAAPPPAKATPSLTGQADPQEATEGKKVTLTDTATLAGAKSPTGVILFALFDNPSCDGDPVVADAASLSGSSATLTVTVTPDAAGTYYWAASYAGDANNQGVDSTCNDPHQRLLVRRGTPVGSPGSGNGGGTTSGPPPEVTGEGEGTPEILPTTGPVPVGPLALLGLGLVLLGGAAVVWARQLTPRRPTA